MVTRKLGVVVLIAVVVAIFAYSAFINVRSEDRHGATSITR
jgi:hypothetical protein